MTTIGRSLVWVLVVALLAFAGGSSAQLGEDPTAGSVQAPASPVDTPLSDGEQQALGCVAGAGVGLAAAAMAGSTEVMLLWGGGMLIPSRASTLWLALLAQIGVSGCAFGAIITPTVLWTVDQSDNIAATVAEMSSNLGEQILNTSVWMGTAAMSTLGWPFRVSSVTPKDPPISAQ
ncbi:MAG: hypothetical protein WCP34_04190 [Pseudomonadota bacterium]